MSVEENTVSQSVETLDSGRMKDGGFSQDKTMIDDSFPRDLTHTFFLLYVELDVPSLRYFKYHLARGS